MTAAVSLPVEREWRKVPYDANVDESGMYYLLGVAYTRSRSGFFAGASRGGRTIRHSESHTPLPGDIARANDATAFLAVHRPVWTWLLENADVTLAIDPSAPPDNRIWGWIITSGNDVVHALGVKRTVIAAGHDIARELVMDLAGDRWERCQQLSLELPQFERPRPTFQCKDLLGFPKPTRWWINPTWLVTRMIGR